MPCADGTQPRLPREPARSMWWGLGPAARSPASCPCTGGSCFRGNTLLASVGLLLAGQLGNAGAAAAPALALAPMGVGGILVVRSCLGSAVEHMGSYNCNICILCLVPLPFARKLTMSSQLSLSTLLGRNTGDFGHLRY